MEPEPNASLDQYLADLAVKRDRWHASIRRPLAPILLETDLVSLAAVALSAHDALTNELRALEATKWFRLREFLVNLVKRFRNVFTRWNSYQPLPLSVPSSQGGPNDRPKTKPADCGTLSLATWFPNYPHWVAQIDRISHDEDPFVRTAISLLANRPRIGIIVAISAGELEQALSFLASLTDQLYQHYWVTLTVSGDTEPQAVARLREAVQGKGEIIPATDAVAEAEGLDLALASQHCDWIIALKITSQLSRLTLFMFADAINRQPNAEMIYCDEDEFFEGNRHSPNFKPDWNDLLLLNKNYLGSAVLMRRERIRSVGGFVDGASHTSRWSLYLRYTAGLSNELIAHVPFVLLHAAEPCDDPLDVQAQLDAVRVGLALRGIEGEGSKTAGSGVLRLDLCLSTTPKVSIIIPTKDHADLLNACIESIQGITDYPEYEILVINNGTEEPEALGLLEHLKTQAGIRVIDDPSPFNYSTLNNKGAYDATGEVLALLNNDVEVIEPDWMSRMVAYATMPEVGVVGARLLYPDRTVQHAGVVVGPWTGFVVHCFIGLNERDPGYQDRAIVDQWACAVTGACMFIRKSVFEDLGGLDSTNFPVAYNDIDLCLKARLSGYQNVYAGSVTCIHHESKSRGPDDTPEKHNALLVEGSKFVARWGSAYTDPYYSPNLALRAPTHQLSYLPRVRKPWRV